MWILRRLLQADGARPTCVIHDYGYFEAALKYEAGTFEWEVARATADILLKRNIHDMTRNRFAAGIRSQLFFVGLRIFGGSAMWKRGRTLPMPPTLEDLYELEFDIAPATERSAQIINAWRKELIRTTNGRIEPEKGE